MLLESSVASLLLVSGLAVTPPTPAPSRAAGSPAKCVLRFSTGTRGGRDFEELGLWLDGRARGNIDYVYGAQHKALALQYDGTEQVGVWPGFMLRFPNGLVLHVVQRSTDALELTGDNGYEKTFTWEKDAPANCARSAGEVRDLVQSAFVPPRPDAPDAAASDGGDLAVPDGFGCRPVGPEDRAALRAICAKLVARHGGVETCYDADWRDDVRHLADQIVPPRELKAINKSYVGAEFVGDAVSFPDGSVHFLWAINEKYTEQYVYWLVDAKTRAVDLVWDFGAGVRYYGPNAKVLERAKAANWMELYMTECP